MAQNLIILILTDKDSTQGHQFIFKLIFYTNDAPFIKYLLALEISQVCCSVIVWFFFISKQAPLVLKKAKDKIYNLDYDSSDIDNILKKKTTVSIKKRIFLMIRNFTIYTTYLIFDPLIMYYFVYVTFAILCMFNPIFVAILLLDVFVRFIYFFDF